MNIAPRTGWIDPTADTFLILGHGRHGKDTVAEIMRDVFGVQFESSSWAAAELCCRPWLEDKYGITYDTLEDCYADRSNHRSKWHDAICSYNAKDPSRLAKAILAKAPVYVGMRSDRECQASRELFNLIIWVDASGRLPLESRESFDIDRSNADIVIDNHEFDPKHKELRRRVSNLMTTMGYQSK